MQSKITTLNLDEQFPAGVALNDHNIEFVANKQTMSCIWLQNGHAKVFSILPKEIYNKLKKQYLSDVPAQKYINTHYKSSLHDIKRQIEIYTCYLFGDLDNQPDVIDGELQPSENFRNSIDCPSLNFTYKNITIDGVELTRRDISILDAFSLGMPDKQIADALKIAQSTFDFHKRNLFKRIGVTHKTDAIVKAFKNNVLCLDQ